ncbi:hypothetical protein [Arthrobacter rhizosphaerae]|uniref:hypothetical protein n=1 Tax=Arthrobacter rhizosphaerae TaxID=2855490 RepID=UPI001FF10991|nr:hypothetical protein [Arthrobacter rhizosphaerae]
MPLLPAGRLWSASFRPRNRNGQPDPHGNVHHLRKPNADVDFVTNRHRFGHRDGLNTRLNTVSRSDQLHNHRRGFDV